jgi:hypothetical protein
MSDLERKHLEPEQLEALMEDPTVLEVSDEAPEIVASLPTQSFVQLVRRLGDERRLDLVIPHATPDQLTGLLDLDAWREERLDMVRARGWLATIADAFSSPDRERGDLTEMIYEMDPEMWPLALAPATAVAEVDPEDDQSRTVIRDTMGALYTWDTPDGDFVIGVPDDEFGRAALRVISLVYADSLEEGRKLVTTIKWGLHAETEEEMLRFRAGRLADLGFVSRDEAMKLFRPLDRETLAGLDGPPPSDAPTSPVRWTGGGELLRQVMARLSDQEHGVRTREFLLLVNELMVAQGFEPGEIDLQQRAVHQAQATLGLALELLSAGAPDEENMLELLTVQVRGAGLRNLFRYAYGPLSTLRRTALALHREGRISLTSLASLLDRPWGPQVRALHAWYPELALESTAKKTRPIASLADLSRATARLAQAGALSSATFATGGLAFDGVWLTRLDAPEQVSLGDLIRTALVHRLRGQADAPYGPLLPDDLKWASESLIREDGLVPAVQSELERALTATGGEAHHAAIAEVVLPRLLVELLGLERDEDGVIDPARVSGLVTIQHCSVWLRTRAGEA